LRAYRALLIGLVFVVVLLLALITLPPLSSGRADALRAHLDTDVQAYANTLTTVENSLQEMQAATRGYILTRQPAYLEQYHAAQDGLPARLQALTEVGPRVDKTLAVPTADVVQAVERWQREGGDYQIGLVQQARVAEAVSEVASGQSQALFTSIRDRINDLQEQSHAKQTELVAQINRTRTLQTALTSGLGVLGLFAIGFVLLGFRSLVALMQALEAERARASDLAQAARNERQRLQTVFDHSPEGLIFAEAPDGRIALANPAATVLIGAVPAGTALREQAWVRRVYRPGGEAYPVGDLPVLRTIERGEASRAVELTIEQTDGQRVPILLTSVPLHAENGTLRGAVVGFQDLRLLREVERLKSDFVALVSHELRTPLTAIQGCVQTLVYGV
jgi:CHASE3 domain sensor protein